MNEGATTMTHTETHSPLPWKFRIGVVTKKPYVESRGDLVCGRFVEDDVEEATGTANAKLIVRSVNALPSLVEALEMAQKVLAQLTDPAAIKATTSQGVFASCIEAETKARAALALAKGE